MCSRSRRRLTYCSSDSPRAPGPGARQRVRGLHDDRLHRLRLDLVVVGLHGVGDGLGLPVLAGEVAADERVRALDLVRDRLADVVQQGGAAGGLRRGAELVGHHRREVRALDRVREHVLAVGRAVLEAAEEPDQLRVEALDVGVEAGLLARTRRCGSRARTWPGSRSPRSAPDGSARPGAASPASCGRSRGGRRRSRRGSPRSACRR